MVSDLCDALSDDGVSVSKDCGYHVHVDARDFDFYAVQRLIEVYARIEDALFSIVAPSRRDNHYCERCGERYLRNSALGGDPADKFAKAIYGQSADDSVVQIAKRTKYHDARYAALNLHSWNFRGTVECRLHQGTVHARNVASWSVLWAGILDFAKHSGAATLPADSYAALLAIAPTPDVRDWVESRRAKFSS